MKTPSSIKIESISENVRNNVFFPRAKLFAVAFRHEPPRSRQINGDNQWGQPLTFVVRSSQTFQTGEAEYLKNLKVS